MLRDLPRGYLGEKCFRQREQGVQRPWGKNKMGTCAEEIAVAEKRTRRDREGGDEVWSQVTEGLVGQDKEFGFYSGDHGKPLEGFMQEGGGM